MGLDIAWRMPPGEVQDQRAENRCEPNEPVSIEELRDLGLLHYRFDPATMLKPGEDGSPSRIEKFCKEMGYANRDEVVCAPGKLPNYEDRIKMFFQEHIHEDEEIRLILDGVGYFDVRDKSDRWIRIRVVAGDLIVLPAGIYHRFTMDALDFTHAMRLFKEAPKWTPINRPCEENQYRQQYLQQLAAPLPAETIFGPVNGDDNLVLKYPTQFDEVIRRIVRSLRPAERDVLLIYLAGAHNPTTHQSWCPDCVASDPIVKNSVLQARAAHPTRRFVFLQVDVERSSYLKNPEYPLRVHPFVTLQCVPTLMVFAALPPNADEPGVDLIARYEDKIGEDWLSKLPSPVAAAEE